MKIKNHLIKPTSSGFTVVELTVVVAISLLMVGVIVSFILGVTDQFAVSTIRGQMNVQVTSATNRLENDLRYSRLILTENSVADTAAPSNDNHWNSGSSQLVLGATARDDSNSPLGSGYTDKLDNYVYYLNGETLYRRLLALPDANNRHATATCTQTSIGGCASDTAILRNVDSLEFVYYNKSGAETSDYDQVTSVKVDIVTKTRQSRQEIKLSSSAIFRLATFSDSSVASGIPDFQGSVNAGYGGVEVGYSSSFDINGDVSTLGSFTISSGSQVKVNNIYTSHLNCGPTYNLKYGTLCPASPAPILTGYGSGITLTADSACAPATPVASNQGSSGIISIANLTTSCDLPDTLPVFDKQALIDSIPPANTTSGSINCFNVPSGSVANLPANHRYLGDVDLSGGCSGKITGSGVMYIDGDFKLGFNSVLDFDPSVTTPVTIVVNGRVTIYNAKVGSSSTPKPNIISFDSTNAACSHSTSCNSLSMEDLYDSGTSVSAGILVHHNLTTVYANLYAPFSTVRFATSPKVETNEIYGQSVDLSFGGLGQFTLAP